MSARALLNVVRLWTIEAVGEDEYWELIHPPTPLERKRRRLAELRALGIEVS